MRSARDCGPRNGPSYGRPPASLLGDLAPTLSNRASRPGIRSAPSRGLYTPLPDPNRNKRSVLLNTQCPGFVQLDPLSRTPDVFTRTFARRGGAVGSRGTAPKAQSAADLLLIPASCRRADRDRRLRYRRPGRSGFLRLLVIRASARRRSGDGMRSPASTPLTASRRLHGATRPARAGGRGVELERFHFNLDDSRPFFSRRLDNGATAGPTLAIHVFHSARLLTHSTCVADQVLGGRWPKRLPARHAAHPEFADPLRASPTTGVVASSRRSSRRAAATNGRTPARTECRIPRLLLGRSLETGQVRHLEWSVRRSPSMGSSRTIRSPGSSTAAGRSTCCRRRAREHDADILDGAPPSRGAE